MNLQHSNLSQTNSKLNPMQTVESRIEFCDRFFAAVGAPRSYEADAYREYQLPRDVDKELTDRPFYWKWVEQTGQDVPPTTLRLAFNEEAEQRENIRVRQRALEAASPYLTEVQKQYFVAPKVELVTLGSFRLDRLYDSSLRRGRFASVAPRSHVDSFGLVPWLMMNALVSYRCDITEQTLVSIGVCLENGQCVEDFHRMIENIDMGILDPRRVKNRMQLSVADGFRRFREVLERKLARDNHQWAAEANQRLKSEVEQIQTYYDSLEHNQTATEVQYTRAERDRKIDQAVARGAARIEIDIKQTALVGLVDKGSLSRPGANHPRP